jgi:alkylation response protein AidB-like acyl-CoA dehydrogenase
MAVSNAGFVMYLWYSQRMGKDKNTGFIMKTILVMGLLSDLREEEHKLGIHSSSTRRVFFNDCMVPVEYAMVKGEGIKKSP